MRHRYKLKKQKTSWRRVHLVLPLEQLQYIRLAAAEAGMSRQAWLRALIEREVATW